MQADFGGRVTPGGGVGRSEAALRARWECWRSRDWERGLMIRLKGAKSGWRGSGLISWCRGGLVRAYGAYEGMPKRLVKRIAAELEGSGMHLGRRWAGADFAEPVGPSVSGTSLRVGWVRRDWEGVRSGQGVLTRSQEGKGEEG